MRLRDSRETPYVCEVAVPQTSAVAEVQVQARAEADGSAARESQPGRPGPSSGPLPAVRQRCSLCERPRSERHTRGVCHLHRGSVTASPYARRGTTGTSTRTGPVEVKRLFGLEPR